MATKLRNEEECDVILALTHMRVPNDQLLAKEVPEIDLILGGHDHFWIVDGENVVEGKEASGNTCYSGGIRILKSGCDFRVCIK